MRSRRMLWCLVVAAAVGCGSEGSESASPAPGGGGAGEANGDGGEAGAVSADGTVIGPKGGVVDSDDGLVTLTVPAGALEDATTISITALDASQNGAAPEGATALGSYRLEPDGLKFAEPATLELSLPELISFNGETASVPMVLGTTFSNGEIEALTTQELALNLTTGDGIYRAELSHFSKAFFSGFPSSNTLATPYFDFLLEPMPADVQELGKDYGVGLHFRVRNLLSQEVGMTYLDESSGLTYSGGTEPVNVGSFVAHPDTPTDEVMDIGTYSCDAEGSASYLARLDFEPFAWEPVPSSDSDDCTPEAPCVVANMGVLDYLVRLKRDVECVAGSDPPLEDEAPYSGYVEFNAIRDIVNGNFQSQLNLSAYFPGQAQANFDAFVARQRRRYGVMPERGASGTCREVPFAEFQSEFPTGFGQLGNATEIGADFISPPSDPLYVATWLGAQQPFYKGSLVQIPNRAPEGLAIYLPIDAAKPAITLPGWDGEYAGIKWSPTVINNATQGVTLTWDADAFGADHVHVWAWSYGSIADPVAFECFANPEDQLLLVPPSVLERMYENEAYGIRLHASSRTSVTFEGKTLEGFFIHSESKTEDPSLIPQ